MPRREKGRRLTRGGRLEGVAVVIEPSRDLGQATRAFAQSLRDVDPLIPISAMQPIEERI